MWSFVICFVFVGFAGAAFVFHAALLRRRNIESQKEPRRSKATPPSPVRKPEKAQRPRKRRAKGAPPALPIAEVAFEYVVVSRDGHSIDEAEFNHRLLLGDSMTHEARTLLAADTLELKCERRSFVQGRAKNEPETFRAVRRLANRGQTTMAQTDRDTLAMARGAFVLRYKGPPVRSGAHLELMVLAVNTILAIRPGFVADRASMIIWGADAWGSQGNGKGGFGPKEHFKVEMGATPGGVGITSRGLLKFGLPDLRIDGLPQDMSGIAAVCLTSLALEIVHSSDPLDPSRSLPLPSINGAIRFQFEPPGKTSSYPAGAFRLLGGVDGAEPTVLGLLEVLARFRSVYESGEDFWRGGSDADLSELRDQAQNALPRLKVKFHSTFQDSKRVFLVRKATGEESAPDREIWIALQEWNGSIVSGAVAVGGPGETRVKGGRNVALEESEILDWMILQGGDVEDGGFALRMGLEEE